MSIIHHDSSLYSRIFLEDKDPKTEHFFLMSSFLYPVLICAAQLYLVFSVLPKHMKNRPAYNIDKFVIGYNAIQVPLNIFILYMTWKAWPKLSFTCSPMSQGDTPEDWHDIKSTYFYFLLKVFDLADTIIFVLRKKSNQITVLHVSHHIGMVLVSWYAVAFWNGGHNYYLGASNCTVHTVMYFYYLLTIWKPEYKKSMWWKRYITQLQIAQFVFLLVVYGNLVIRPECPVPRALGYFGMAASSLMLVLFCNFYYKTYIQIKSKKV